MSLFASISIAEIKARGSIKDADVARLRKNFADEAIITGTDCDALRSLNDACPIQDPAWRACFVDLLTEFLVEQTEPTGYMNAGNCALLRSWIAPEGRIETKAKLDLLINVIAASRWVPQSLAVFGLEQVRYAVVEGSGPLRAGRVFEPRTVTEGDVAIMRQIMQAFATEGCEGVSRDEACVLLDIDRATAGSSNHPAWTQLYTAALGTALLAASGYLAPPRAQSLARMAWHVIDPDLDDMLAGRVTDASAIIREFKLLAREEQAILRLTQQKVGIVTREDVHAYEPGWIAEYLSGTSNWTPNMISLLRLLKREGCPLDQRLQMALAQVPAAA